MTKKLFFVLMISSLILFFSCGSTKQTDENVKDLEPVVETEEEALDSSEETAQDELNNQDEQNDSTLEQTNDEEILKFYPPLEEIEDPDLIDISPQEIEEAEVAKAALTEQEEIEKNKITEPVEETEELPPLPMTEQESQTETEGSLENENSETVENIEPTIEVQTEDEVEPEPEILPSRSVSLKKGETLVITYPGSGWIYMGSTSEYNNLASRGRKLGTTDTKYTLLAKEAGTQIHHFYKVDNLTGEYIDDYIEVTVLEKKGSSSTVVNAPDYSQVVPKKPETPAKATPKQTQVQKEETSDTKAVETKAVETKATETKTAETKTNQTSTPAVSKKDEITESKTAPEPEPENEDDVIVIDEEETEQVVDLEPLLEKARTGIASKKYDDAYTSLTQYLEWSTDNRDEALYLLGQLLESDSKYKDIKQAVETYQTLCDSYPASKYWENANTRIVYLKRFYLNIH